MNYSYLSILPVIIVLGLAFITKKVIPALICGILLGLTILSFSEKGLINGIYCITDVVTNDWSVNSLVFCALIGAFVFVIEASGGVKGMVSFLTSQKRLISNGVTAQLLTYLIGILVFIDGVSSIVVAGVTGRHLFDKFHVSRNRLAYIVDSTSSPVAWLLPINAAGAFLIAMIHGQELNVGNPMEILVKAIPFQLYSIMSIIIVGYNICVRPENPHLNDKLKREELVVESDGREVPIVKDESKFQMKNMLYPLLALICVDILVLLITGDGNIFKGDAIKSLVISVLFSLVFTGLLYKGQNLTGWNTYLKWCRQGVKSFLGIIAILALAFVMSNILKSLETGAFIAGLIGEVHLVYMPLVVFLLGVLISFSTGTSGGTVAILISIVFPMASQLEIDMPIVLGAIISGAVFGDHCSPVSDSTILSSMIAEVPAMEHVKYQIPYALLSGVLSAIGFILIGLSI